MRIVASIFAGSVAVLTILASPALANGTTPSSHADANAKTDEAPPASCYAYQQAPDGSWTQLACHEGGAAAPAPVHAKSASHHTGEETTTH